MTIWGFIIYFAIVVVGIIIGICAFTAISCLLFNDASDGMMVIGLFVGIIVAIYINCGIGEKAAENAVLKETQTIYEVSGITLMEKQVSKYSSVAAVVWTDKDGFSHSTEVANIQIIDNDDWKMVKTEYEVTNFWSDLFYDKEKTWVLYVPIEQIHGSTK